MMEMDLSCFTFYFSLLILRFAPLHELAFVPGEGGTRSVTAMFAQQTCLSRSEKDEVDPYNKKSSCFALRSLISHLR